VDDANLAVLAARCDELIIRAERDRFAFRTMVVLRVHLRVHRDIVVRAIDACKEVAVDWLAAI
jgi:hypothetical protein